MKVLRRLFLLLALAPLAAATVPARAVPYPEEASEEGSVMFDGAGRYAKAASPRATAQDKAQLLAEFKKHVVIDDHGVPAERAALDSMLARMMESPTAREIAVKFINEGARVAVSLEEIPGSTVVTVDGKKTFWGTRGYTLVNKDPPPVVMNKLYMHYDRDFGTGGLAHEMLGHAFESQRVSGDLGDVYRYNWDEEENARLIGWLVRTELDIKPEDEVWAYMQNPEDNMEALKMVAPAYSLKLTSSEMKDPVPVYKKRLDDADKALKRLIQRTKNCGNWSKVIDHFVNKHKMDPASFRTIRDDISNVLKDLPAGQENLKEIKEALQERLTYFSGAKGKNFLSKLAKESDNDYFKQKDAVIMERRERLSGLLLGKTQESFKTPPALGQITWDQLVELWESDRKSCLSANEVFK